MCSAGSPGILRSGPGHGEEICYPVLLGWDPHTGAMIEDAVADHNDISEAVEEAQLLGIGAARWWRAVGAAHALCTEHFASEEQNLVAVVSHYVNPEASQLLAHQWTRFVAAQQVGPP